MNVATSRAGVYVHFPWCLAKCPYCDFVSYVAPAIDHAGYADAVLREVEARAPSFGGRQVESVFFGGGTPSLWEAAELGRVLEGVRRQVGGAAGANASHSGPATHAGLATHAGPATPAIEVTVECNPTSLDEERARALLDVGVNRLSIGVQSLTDDRLRFLGRLHDAAGARAAVKGAIAAGMPRVSADLIFGLPGQSPEEARREALELADLGVAHLSAYQLTIEAGTRFGELARRGRLPLADDGQVAESFLAIDEALAARGFGHYEISNYAQPGEEARHNVGYWRGDEYLGVGCGAYGFARETSTEPSEAQPAQAARQATLARPMRPVRGVRWRNEVVPERYVLTSTAVTAETAPDGSRESLDGETLLRERIMLGLRMGEGIDLEAIARDLGVAAWTPERERAAAWLTGRARIVREGRRLRIPRAAWLWTDDTAARLF
jgi:coproporphyrinogen III oxidase-like Fe-S oxidoreductase